LHDTTLAGAAKGTVAEALTEARNAPDADLAIAVIGSSAQFRPQEAVAGVIAAMGKNPLIAFLTPEAPQSLRLLAEAGIASFRTPESCADAVRAWLDWRVPRTMPVMPDISIAKSLLPLATDEPGARAVFAALGLPDGAVLVDPDEPPPLAYPVALKAVSPGLAHKTEAGAVVLDITDSVHLRSAAADLRTRLRGGVTGFLAQPMARGVVEAILGFRRDPLIGPVIMLGTGGVLAEIFRDIVLRIAPVSEEEAAEMIGEVRGLAPARGYRGLPRGDLAALAGAIARFSALAALPEVAEAEINPLILMPEGNGVVVADALLRIL
jgi:acetate---CoA ligase (ADP-forming)